MTKINGLVLTTKMKDGITRVDVREECITEALAFGGSLDQTGNVHHIEIGRHFAVMGENEQKQSVNRGIIAIGNDGPSGRLSRAVKFEYPIKELLDY